MHKSIGLERDERAKRTGGSIRALASSAVKVAVPCAHSAGNRCVLCCCRRSIGTAAAAAAFSYRAAAIYISFPHDDALL